MTAQLGVARGADAPVQCWCSRRRCFVFVESWGCECSGGIRSCEGDVGGDGVD